MTIANRCAVLGRPIAHSLSPVLHNAAYRALGLDDWEYGRHDVGEEDLDAFLRGLDPSWRGLSLTMPLKRTIQPYGTPSNLWARELGVANTAVLDWTSRAGEGPWADGPAVKLYNTDVIGIVLAQDHADRELGAPSRASKDATALVIGNGNTAASAVAALTMRPGVAHVTVAARTPGKNPTTRRVAERFIRSAAAYDEIALDDAEALRARAAEAAYVINTIPGHAADGVAGMLDHGAFGEDGLPGLLLDVVYDPRPTRLMHVWRARGGHAVGGEEMLLYQALVQVLLMTGEWDGDPPSDAERRLLDVTTDDDGLEIAMRRALEEAL